MRWLIPGRVLFPNAHALRGFIVALSAAFSAGLIPQGALAQNTPATASSAPDAPTGTANITTEVYFDKGAFKLGTEARARLDAWLRATEGVKAAFILSIGHTDPGEAPNYPKAVKLSEDRASAVRAYLAGKGIEAGRVYVEGKGDTQPVATNDTPSERAKNRRVDVGMVGERD